MMAERQLASPSLDDITSAISDRSPAVRETALVMRALVLETLPGVNEVLDTHDGMIGYGAHQFGASGWGDVAIAAFTSWVDLGFIVGAALPDPAGLLEGSGKSTRHVKLRSV